MSGYNYKTIYDPNHAMANKQGYIKIHRYKASNALGRALKTTEQVHHADLDKDNNENCNLVVCEDQAYHKLLHRRTEALRACGKADWLKCVYCKEHDALLICTQMRN